MDNTEEKSPRHTNQEHCIKYCSDYCSYFNRILSKEYAP